jgi:spermidine/putrescine transport system ATP-binding protein
MLSRFVSTEAISLANIKKRFGDVAALDGISLEVGRGEFFSLLGPSGCGKTTLLRLIAGLDNPDSGTLAVYGKSMLGIPPQQRPVNTVFQNYALFPHLTVFENVAFGLRMRRTPKPEVKSRVANALELTAISELSSRLPSQLSGGQKQRVALARALINEPSVLLLDEPLAAVDAKLRAQLQTELKALQRRLGMTFLYVTHDQDEALALSDRVAILSRGRVAQFGRPEEVYERPRSKFVASFLGNCNVLEGKVRSNDGGFTTVETPAGLVSVPELLNSASGEVLLGIRREKIRLGESTAGVNVLQGRISEVSFTGPETEFSIQVGEALLHGWMANAGGTALKAGEMITVQLPPESLLVLDPE